MYINLLYYNVEAYGNGRRRAVAAELVGQVYTAAGQGNQENR